MRLSTLLFFLRSQLVIGRSVTGITCSVPNFKQWVSLFFFVLFPPFSQEENLVLIDSLQKKGQRMKKKKNVS